MEPTPVQPTALKSPAATEFTVRGAEEQIPMGDVEGVPGGKMATPDGNKPAAAETPVKEELTVEPMEMFSQEGPTIATRETGQEQP